LQKKKAREVGSLAFAFRLLGYFSAVVVAIVVAVAIIVTAMVVQTTLIADTIKLTPLVICLPTVVTVLVDRLIQLMTLVPNLPRAPFVCSGRSCRSEDQEHT